MLRARKPLVVGASHGYNMMKGLAFASSSRCAAASNSASINELELENVLVEQRERVGIITFNRPKVGAERCYQYRTTCVCLFPEGVRLVHSWTLETSHLDTASFHYLRNGPTSLISSFTFFSLLREVSSSHKVPAELSLAHQPSSAQQRTAALDQQRSAVRCRE